MLVQWPIGRFSDGVDRRRLILGTCLVAALAGLLLTLQRDASEARLLILAACYGASSLSIYSLCVAHANDRADPALFIEVSSHLLLAFAVGAILGPFMVSLLISEVGMPGLFVFTASIHAALALFVLVHIRTHEAPPEAERSVFGLQPPQAHRTQAVLKLHPGREQAVATMAEQNRENE